MSSVLGTVQAVAVRAVGVAVQHISRPQAEDQEQYDLYLQELLLQSGLSSVTDLATAGRASSTIISYINLYTRTAASGCLLLTEDHWQEELGSELGTSRGGVEFIDWLVGQFGSDQGTEAPPGWNSPDIIQKVV